jgi:hypothetical protein
VPHPMVCLCSVNKSPFSAIHNTLSLIWCIGVSG